MKFDRQRYLEKLGEAEKRRKDILERLNVIPTWTIEKFILDYEAS